MTRDAAVCTLLVVTVLLAGVAPASGLGDASSVGTADAPSFSSVHFIITVHEDGSAEWTFQYRTPLENDSQRADFREFAARFENETLALYEDFRDRARALVADGENVSSRSMNATDFSRSAYITGLSNNLGVVEMSFTWTNFARVAGDRVRVGALFEGGLYVGADQRLVIEAGDGLRFASVRPHPDSMSGQTVAASDSVTWFGPIEFADERPQATLTTAPLTTTTATTPTTAGTPTSGAAPAGPPWLVSVLLAVVLVLAAVVGAVWWRYRREEVADAGGAGGATTEPAVPDEELLSDEDRVRGLLEDHGGRMRQVQIVEETDWSKSKVSMLLSEMEDADEISRLRIGRENVVSLPGHEPGSEREE
ncbi:hypothetical protein [Salarchaeum sp. JOR-1]|uniref:helix-turn-helix transcriptional regulator n=1 Tax=Salarchaeum sp. JOR-1 TaxID=2599399 RepID=UPI001198A8A9|nr:hypothetical protein [Salarchaeum sp. JOR-1]QDX41151.1 hypothetical protein FQU85_09645 [Salarchaeum sp. JOR-1]